MTASNDERAGVGTDRRRAPLPPASLRTATFVLFGISAVAITQPVLDILGRNAEFFIAGNYSRGQIIALALIVAWVPGALALAATALAALIHHRVRVAVYSLAVAGFSALFALVLLRDLGVDGLAATVPVAALVAAAVVFTDRHVAAVRTFLTYLFAANLVFLGSFLFLSRSSELVVSASDASTGTGEVSIPDLPGPVVVVVLDEFPLTTLLRPDGTINEERFPNFARLAGASTWFRNASSLSSRTHLAVPEMLTGRTVEPDQLPSYRDHPRNLLTLVGRRYPVHRYEVVTDLCPPTICETDERGSLRTAIEDVGTIYGHLMLPGRLRADLPDISHGWGGFGDDLDGVMAAPADVEKASYEKWNSLGSERSAWGQAQVLRERGAAVTGDPAVHLIHVALPHYRWVVNRSGLLTLDFPPVMNAEAPEYAQYRLLAYQLHVMQVGATDRAIGELVDDLERRGIWDDALVAILSDHGMSLSPPDYGRTVTEANKEEALRMPLFVKAPGQTRGETRDDVALTTDLLPSIVDLLDIRTDWEFDGHSLFDGSSPTLEPTVSADFEAALDVVEAHGTDFPYGDDWIGLAAVGDHGDLVGTEVADLDEGTPSDLRWSALRQAELAHLPTPDGRVPYVLAGWVAGGGAASPPPQVVVELNGRIAGTVPTYRPEEGGRWRFDAFLADFFVDGANEVNAYEVERTGGGPVLHRLSPAAGP